jgi:hypothetical protein
VGVSSRGTIFLQVLMAVVCLAVIGGVIGLALGLRDRDSGSGETLQQPPASPSAYAKPCEQPIAEEAAKQGAQGGLTQVFYVVTDESEVWICQDSQGSLFYQGHRGDPEDRPIQTEGKDWLFLTDVQRSGDGYVATNASPTKGNTVYQVTREKLTIVYPGGTTEEQPVESVVSG